MSQQLQAVKATVIDGRTRTVFHRQVQLEKLHKTLVSESKAIQDAISSDCGYTQAEIAAEVYEAVKCVREAYDSVQPKDALQEEYSVTHNKNVADHREPFGIVYIEPTRHTMLYSVMSPLASAIASGNCIVIRLPNDLRAVTGVLRRVLSSALENDTFAVVDSLRDGELPSTQTVQVLQESDEVLPRSNQLVSRSSSPVVAVVDRTADIHLAAKELVAARFSFNGKSPYAPDLVLVNEFVKGQLLQAIVQETISRSSKPVDMNGSVSGKSSKTKNITKALDSMRENDSELKVITQESTLAVVERASRSNLLKQKLNLPILAIHSIRSLDDAIDLVSKQIGNSTCLATYHFAHPRFSKYLCQFIDSSASFINHIPSELLLGPAYPHGHTLDLKQRYPQELFTQSRPQYIVGTGTADDLSAALASSDNAVAHKLLTEAGKALVPMKRHSGAATGFFEQGILISAGMILFCTLSASIGGGLWLRARFR